jgi:hypothetical protein
VLHHGVWVNFADGAELFLVLIFALVFIFGLILVFAFSE